MKRLILLVAWSHIVHCCQLESSTANMSRKNEKRLEITDRVKYQTDQGGNGLCDLQTMQSIVSNQPVGTPHGLTTSSGALHDTKIKNCLSSLRKFVQICQTNLILLNVCLLNGAIALLIKALPKFDQDLQMLRALCNIFYSLPVLYLPWEIYSSDNTL